MRLQQGEENEGELPAGYNINITSDRRMFQTVTLSSLGLLYYIHVYC